MALPLAVMEYDSPQAVAAYLQQDSRIHATRMTYTCGCGRGNQRVVIAWAVTPGTSYDLYSYDPVKATDCASGVETFFWKRARPRLMCHLDLVPHSFEEYRRIMRQCDNFVSSTQGNWQTTEFDGFAKQWMDLTEQAARTPVITEAQSR